jgi:ent-kaurene oxidase
MSSMVFLGRPACRNPEWLQLCVDYSINVFTTSLTLRMFPPFTHPLVARLLPSRRLIRQNIQAAERILAPIIEGYDQRLKDRKEDELPTMLDWMLENDPGKERQIEELAVRQLILTLASIHSTASTVTQALFDLCAHPELIEPLQEEAKAVWELSGGTFKKEYLPRLELLDSFLVESARLNPLILR